MNFGFRELTFVTDEEYKPCKVLGWMKSQFDESDENEEFLLIDMRKVTH